MNEDYVGGEDRGFDVDSLELPVDRVALIGDVGNADGHLFHRRGHGGDDFALFVGPLSGLFDAQRHCLFGLGESGGTVDDVPDDALELVDEGIEPVGDIANFVAFTDIEALGEVGFAAGDLLQGAADAAERAEDEGAQADREGQNEDDFNTDREVPTTVRQIKYLNNIVEQDHRAVKRITKPMMGFKSFRAAGHVLAGIELMHMILKGQVITAEGDERSFADQFYALAA